jgi:hypothetical protein
VIIIFSHYEDFPVPFERSVWKNAKGDERKMQLRKISFVLLALLLAAMAIVPMVNASDPALQKNESRQNTGIITPIFDDSEIVMMEPVNESEMVSFVFSENLVNGRKGAADTVSITIPRSQISKNLLDATKGSDIYLQQDMEKTAGRVALLQIPKTLFEQNNPATSDQITLDYPLTDYSFYSSMTELTTAVKERKTERITKQRPGVVRNTKKSVSSAVTKAASTSFYAEWDLWKRSDTSYTPVALRGDMKPDTFSNSGQSIEADYHETEIHLNRANDVVELVLWYCDDGHIWLSAPIYDEGVLKWGTGGTGMKWVDASAKNRMNYEFYVNPSGQYSINFYNTGTGMWYTFNYDDSDNPSTYINRIVPSTELTTVAVTKSFDTITNTMRAYNTKDSGSSSWIGAGQRFSHDYPQGSASYVLLNAYKIGDIIYSYHRAANNQS